MCLNTQGENKDDILIVQYLQEFFWCFYFGYQQEVKHRCRPSPKRKASEIPKYTRYIRDEAEIKFPGLVSTSKVLDKLGVPFTIASVALY